MINPQIGNFSFFGFVEVGKNSIKPDTIAINIKHIHGRKYQLIYVFIRSK